MLDECRRTCDADADCNGGQACMETDDNYRPDGPCAGGECYCAWPPQGMMEFVTSHELGHLIQGDLAGNAVSGAYLYECPMNGDCEDFGEVAYWGGDQVLMDPMNMHSSCACGHVFAANGAHCLQSIEVTPGAQGEGYAQFFGGLMWNRGGDSCTFNYYKEVLDEDCRSNDPGDCFSFDGAQATMPPVSVGCWDPVKWRNRNECGVDGNTSSGARAEKVLSGTEWDWMTFLSDLHRVLTFGEIMEVYRATCDDSYSTSLPLSQLGRCTNGNIYWEDAEDAQGNLIRHGFLNGAQRRFGDFSEEARDLLALGNKHGVSADLTR